MNTVAPFVWQFSPFIAFVAVVVEIALDWPGPAVWLSLGRAALGSVIVALSLLPIWRSSHLRRTNLDVVAAVLSRQAAAGDLIIVTSFWFFPAFDSLYHGPAKWNILPFIPIDHESRMTYGLHVKKLLSDDHALQPAFEEAMRTLRAGRRVWCVVWDDNSSVWVTQFDQFLRQHALRRTEVDIALNQPVCSLEDLSLFYTAGWR